MDKQRDTLLTVRLAAEGEDLSVDALPMSLLGSLGKGITTFILGGAKSDADKLVFRLEEGSILLRFLAPAAVASMLFSSGLGESLESLNAGFLPKDTKRAKALNDMQQFLQEEKIGTRTLEFDVPRHLIEAGIAKVKKVTLSKNTELRTGTRMPRIFEEGTIRGNIEKMGNEDDPGFDVRIDDVQKLVHVRAAKDQLTGNPNLFLPIIAKVRYRINPDTGERADFSLVHFIEKPADPKTILGDIIREGTKAWADVQDPDAWLLSLREGQR